MNLYQINIILTNKKITIILSNIYITFKDNITYLNVFFPLHFSIYKNRFIRIK